MKLIWYALFFLLFFSNPAASIAQKDKESSKPGKKGKPPKTNITRADNQKDEQGRKQGLWRFVNIEKILVYEVTYLNDVKHGPARRYHAGTGTQIEESNYYNGKLDGEYRSYYVAGQMKSEGSYSNGKRTGDWINYYQVNGEKKSEGSYVNGMKQGEWHYYHSKGYMTSKGSFVNDQQEGVWIYYNEQGKVIEQKTFVKGNETSSTLTPAPVKPTDTKAKKTGIKK